MLEMYARAVPAKCPGDDDNVEPAGLRRSQARSLGDSHWRLTLLHGPLLGVLLAGSSSAGETVWQEIAPDVRARLISSDTLKADGTMLVGLEIAMPVTTRTYWRVPGETGIPTELDLSSSQGVSLAAIHWPFPTIETSKGYLDYAYFGPTVVPFSVVLASPAGAALQVTALMGICLEICVPASADFSLPLDTEPDPGQALRLNQAMASVPIVWPADPSPFGDVAYTASEELLRVEVVDPTVDLHSIIADVGDPDTLFGAPIMASDGQTVSLPLLATSRGVAFNGGPVRLTFMTSGGPYELWLEATSM